MKNSRWENSHTLTHTYTLDKRKRTLLDHDIWQDVTFQLRENWAFPLRKKIGKYHTTEELQGKQRRKKTVDTDNRGKKRPIT